MRGWPGVAAIYRRPLVSLPLGWHLHCDPGISLNLWASVVKGKLESLPTNVMEWCSRIAEKNRAKCDVGVDYHQVLLVKERSQVKKICVGRNSTDFVDGFNFDASHSLSSTILIDGRVVLRDA